MWRCTLRDCSHALFISTGNHMNSPSEAQYCRIWVQDVIEEITISEKLDSDCNFTYAVKSESSYVNCVVKQTRSHPAFGFEKNLSRTQFIHFLNHSRENTMSRTCGCTVIYALVVHVCDHHGKKYKVL